MSCPKRKQIADSKNKQNKYINVKETKSNQESISEEENQERINKLKEAGLLKENKLSVSESSASDKEKKS